MQKKQEKFTYTEECEEVKESGYMWGMGGLKQVSLFCECFSCTISILATFGELSTKL